MRGDGLKDGKVKLYWSIRRTPTREQLLQALSGALAALAGKPATAPECVGSRALDGGDHMMASTALQEQRWSLRAGRSEITVTTTPICSGQGVTGEYLACEGTFTGLGCLSTRMPGYVALQGMGEACTTAFLAGLGPLGTPTAESLQEAAVEGLRYFKAFGDIPGRTPRELVELLAPLPPEDSMGALGRLWLGWQALAEGNAEGALRQLAPLAALGEALEVAVPADVGILEHLPPPTLRLPQPGDLRLALWGVAQPAHAYPLLGMGLALARLGRRPEAVEALTRGLALCKEPRPNASTAARQARAALAEMAAG
jgi:hypothetical protein